jgi:ABC-type sugar transport system ATPase subunit
VKLGEAHSERNTNDQRVTAKVTGVEDLGSRLLVDLRHDGHAFVAAADPPLPCRAGDHVAVHFDTQEVRLFDASTEQLL